MENTNKHSLTEGNIWRGLVMFAIPILVSSLFQQFYAAADTIIVGRFCGDEALAAIGATSSMINMVIGFFLGLAAGAGVVVAQYFGARDIESVSKAVHTSMLTAVGAGLILTVGGTVFAPACMRVIGCPDNVFDLAVDYLRIIYLGSIVNMIYNMGAGILRAVGDSRRPLYYLAVSIILNIILDLVFVGPLDMGIAGAAWATITAQALSAVLVTISLIRTRGIHRVTLGKLKIDKNSFIRVIALGVPVGMQSVAIMLSNLIMQAYINDLGYEVMAAWTSFNKIDNFVYMPLCAFGIAITTFVGQNVGAMKLDRARHGVRICMILTAVTAIVCGIAATVFIRPMLAMFTENKAVIEHGAVMAICILPFYTLYGLIEVYGGAVKGSGRALQVMGISLIGLCAVRVLYLVLADLIFGGSLYALMFVYPVTWLITGFTFFGYYKLKPFE